MSYLLMLQKQEDHFSGEAEGQGVGQARETIFHNVEACACRDACESPSIQSLEQNSG
ncbi:MAG: hypothetical protein Q8N13_07065 [Acidovorax sp.]|nr:hypothetical protein [Acidovorax sp.]